MSFFVSLGVFLLLAARRPWEHRLLIAFSGFWSLLHSAVMAVESVQALSRGVHRDSSDVFVVGALGIVLLAVTPRSAKKPAPQPDAVAPVPG